MKQMRRDRGLPADGLESCMERLSLQPESIFEFPEGIPAFDDVRQYVFICNPDISPFVVMKAIDGSELSFLCIDPFLICPDYLPEIGDGDTSLLDLASPSDVLMLSIVTIRDDVHDTTANLQGPIAVNMRNRKGRQIICEGTRYPVRYHIGEALDRLARLENSEAADEASDLQPWGSAA